MSRLPPDVSTAITSVQTVVTNIDAPISTVWDVLLDFPSYPLWNTYIRSQEITDSSFKPLGLLANPSPTEGAFVLLKCRLPPRGLDDDDKGLVSSKEVISVLDEKNKRIAWVVVGIPRWLLRCERWQELTEERVNERTLTTYRTVEVWNGPAAWLIRWFLRTKLVASFDAMGQGLKKRSEELATHAQSS